jgi:hypothetical protein
MTSTSFGVALVLQGKHENLPKADPKWRKERDKQESILDQKQNKNKPNKIRPTHQSI